MHLNLKPETQKFIEEQVSTGRFLTAEELIEEAVARMMLEDEAELDEDTLQALKRADEQFARGEGIDFETVAAEMRRKMATR